MDSEERDNALGSPTLESSTEALIESFVSNLREICRSEYARGGRDALAHIAQMVGDPARVSDFKQSFTVAPSRAPRGASRTLVERALQSGPQTIAEIRAAAKMDVEKALSYQTVRLELERGKKTKRYKKVKDKWSFYK